MEINQRLVAVWGSFIQEKWMNLSNSEQWALQQFELAYSHSSLPSSVVALKTKSLKSQWKLSGWQLLEGAEWGMCSFKVSFPENCHYLTCMVVLWKILPERISLFELTQLALCEKTFHWGHQSKIFRGNLTSLLPKERDNSEGKQ